MRAARAARAAFLALFVFLLSLSAIPVGTAQCATSAPFNQSSCAAFAVTPDPVCVPANYTAVQALLNSYPNCAPLLEAAEARGDGIWLPADPAANATSWALYSVALTQVAAGYFGVARATGSFLIIPGATKACVHAWLRFSCSQIFRACDPRSQIPLPRAPCFDSCNLLDTVPLDESVSGAVPNATCRQGITKFLTEVALQPANIVARLLPSCTRCETGCAADLSAPEVYGEPAYPAAAQVWQVAPGTTVPVQCAAYSADAFLQNDALRELFPCHNPWVAAEPTDTRAYCGLACPLRIVPQATYNGVALMCAILAWISYLLSAVVIATMVFIPRYRRFPSNMILFAVLGSHIVQFAFLFLTTRGWKRTTCKNSIEYSFGLNRANGPCVFQALTLQVGINVLAWAWACIGINSMISIGLRKDKWFKSPLCYVPQYLLVFGFTIGCAVGALIRGNFAGTPGFVSCASNVPPTDYKLNHWAWNWLFLYFPLGLSCAIVIPCVAISIVGMRHFRDESSARVQRHVRVILFLLVFFLLFALAFAYRIYYEINSKKFSKGFNTIWAQSALLAPTPPPTNDLPSKGFFYVAFFVYTVSGILIALLFGTNKDVLYFWRDRFANISRGRSFFASATETDEGSLEGSTRTSQFGATYTSNL